MDLPVDISTLQHTDRWIGAPLCAILTLVRRIFESAGRPGPCRGDLMTHRLLYNPRLHTSHMFEAMVEALTRDPAVLPTFDFTPSVNQPLARFRPSPSEVAEINAFLERENPRIGSAPLVLL